MVAAAAPTTGLRTRPWRHQADGLDFARGLDGPMLAMKMGHGKSLVALALHEAWGAERTLILCPKSVVAVWPDQFARHLADPPTVLALDRGTVARRVADATALLDRPGRAAIVVNYEAAIQPTMAKLLLGRPWDLVIADESHRLKRPGGVASKLASKLRRQAGRRLALTGTPMPHSPLDIWAQARFLDPRHLSPFGQSYVVFRNWVAVINPMFPGKVDRWKNLDELERKLARFVFRSPDDAVELPAATHVTRTCELSATARKVYRGLERDFTASLEALGAGDATVTAANVLVKLLRLQQVTSGFVRDDDGDEHPIDTGKAALLDDTLQDLAPDEPVVVFCRFRHDLYLVRAAAERAGHAYRELSGRANELAAWQAGDGTVLGVQLQSGGVGIDLTRARVCVYYSKDFNLGAFDQSLARVHRPGQMRPVLYVHLVAEGTVDEKIDAALAARRDLVEALLEGLRR